MVISRLVCESHTVRPTLYEFAGGRPAFLALAEAHHARCLADPELNHPFSHPGLHPRHAERLADYWAEVCGGPTRFSETCGGHSAVLLTHSGEGDLTDLGRRFYECFVAAMDDAGLPADAEFREAMRAYMRAAVAEMLRYPDEPPPSGLPMPSWSWDGATAR
jgi:hemoglobin